MPAFLLSGLVTLVWDSALDKAAMEAALGLESADASAGGPVCEVAGESWWSRPGRGPAFSVPGVVMLVCDLINETRESSFSSR